MVKKNEKGKIDVSALEIQRPLPVSVIKEYDHKKAIKDIHSIFDQLLDNYCLMVDELLKRKSKRLTLTIQLISYLFIGIIVIFIYQVLFIPMQAISGF